ncbi:MAG: tRNA (adenosine(37)-N6)-threonylcarbamoyltransferase complex dimerization subunit type 1 TsaB [Clostridia bacterium]|nr:tRNA (adenosine(37)-N6)-threonylcarbamoyltransferase complex dimerization subunit type 1 TsaB [Clostridia bacterium]
MLKEERGSKTLKILAIDTSGPVCGVAVMKDGAIVYEASAINKMTHSVNLLPMIDTALQSAGMAVADLDRVAVVSGPGSFTGVRIGVSTVKGLAHAHNTPCVAVDALECMAAGAGEFDGVICPIQDARAGQVYGAAFKAGSVRPERLMEDTPLKLEEYVAHIKNLGERFLFLGDGMPVHRAKLGKLLGDSAVFAQPQLAFLRPACAAYLAALAEETVDYLALEPLYLRAPNAALNKKLTEGLANGK